MGELIRYRDQADAITDWPDAVLLFLRHLHDRGELVSYTPMHPVIDDRGRVTVRYVRRELAPRPTVAARPAPARWSVRRRVGVAAAVATGIAVPTALALWWLWAHRILVVGVLVGLGALVIWWGAGQAGACPGLHCPGCKCR
jgi:hypothetical protein